MGEQPQTAAFLYTQDLRGDLRFLPKLSRRLMQLRLEERRTLTFDLGGNCAPDMWHCNVTQGRSMLIALDGLNYAAVNAEGLPADARPNLTKSLVYMQAVDATHPGGMSGVRFVTRIPPDGLPDKTLTLVIAPHAEARAYGSVIEFPAVGRYQIGRMRANLSPSLEIVSVEVLDVPPDIAPDATISGMVDFIESEARQYERRRQK